MYGIMKDALGAAAVLVSPCDPDRTAAMNENEDNWSTFGPGAPVACEGTSYVFVEGADIGRPGTVLTTTRNLEDDIASRWVGADTDEGDDNVMNLLNAGEGQAVSSDGSARQASDADLVAEGGELTGRHLRETGGVTQGPSGTGLLACGGGGNFEPAGTSLSMGGFGTGQEGKHDYEWFNKLLGLPTGTDPNNFGFRMDGKISIPQDGAFSFGVMHDDDVWLWVDSNGNSKIDSGEARTRNGWSGRKYINNFSKHNLKKGNVRYAVVLYEHGGGNHVNIRMSGPGVDGSKDIPVKLLKSVNVKAKQGDKNTHFNNARNATGGW
jgi:hypothetical protein